jgi:hypothetical protein
MTLQGLSIKAARPLMSGSGRRAGRPWLDGVAAGIYLIPQEMTHVRAVALQRP